MMGFLKRVWGWIKNVFLFVIGGLGLLIAAPFALIIEGGYQIFKRIKDGAWPDNYPVLQGWYKSGKQWWHDLWN